MSVEADKDEEGNSGSGVAILETNRFGFIVGNGETDSDAPCPELVRHRETKWLGLIKQWEQVIEKKNNKVKGQCQKGIPTSVRAKCWPLLCGAMDRMKQNEKLYAGLIEAPDHQGWTDIIKRDTDRQFPFHEMFQSKDGHGQKDLLQVLKAYTQYKPDEGYCQGQGPVAAVLLMNMPAEEAFWCLAQISEHYLPGYYSPLLEGVLFDAAVLSNVLKKLCPAAHKHLQNQGVEPLMFATDWLMCLYSRHLPFNTLLRVWDLFFCYGVRVLFQVAVVLVRRCLGEGRHRKECDGQMETLERLRGVKQRVQNDQTDAFIHEVCSVALSSADLQKQTEKEMEKWKKERPESTFDPRGRCHGYRMAWERVQNKQKENEKKERQKGSLTLPLMRSHSSLSPHILRKKFRKRGSRSDAEEWDGGGRKVSQSMMEESDDGEMRRRSVCGVAGEQRAKQDRLAEFNTNKQKDHSAHANISLMVSSSFECNVFEEVHEETACMSHMHSVTERDSRQGDAHKDNHQENIERSIINQQKHNSPAGQEKCDSERTDGGVEESKETHYHEQNVERQTCKDGQKSESETCPDGQKGESETCPDGQKGESETCQDGQKGESETCQDGQISESETSEERQKSESETSEERQKSESETSEERQKSESETCQDEMKSESETCQDRQKSESETCQDETKLEIETCQDRQKSESETCQERHKSEIETCQEETKLEIETSQDRQKSESETCQERHKSESETCQDETKSESETCQDEMKLEIETYQDRQISESETCQEETKSESETCQDEMKLEIETCQDRQKSESETCQEEMKSESETCQDRQISESGANQKDEQNIEEQGDQDKQNVEIQIISGLCEEDIPPNETSQTNYDPQEEHIQTNSGKQEEEMQSESNSQRDEIQTRGCKRNKDEIAALQKARTPEDNHKDEKIIQNQETLPVTEQTTHVVQEDLMFHSYRGQHEENIQSERWEEYKETSENQTGAQQDVFSDVEIPEIKEDDDKESEKNREISQDERDCEDHKADKMMPTSEAMLTSSTNPESEGESEFHSDGSVTYPVQPRDTEHNNLDIIVTSSESEHSQVDTKDAEVTLGATRGDNIPNSQREDATAPPSINSRDGDMDITDAATENNEESKPSENSKCCVMISTEESSQLENKEENDSCFSDNPESNKPIGTQVGNPGDKEQPKDETSNNVHVTTKSGHPESNAVNSVDGSGNPECNTDDSPGSGNLRNSAGAKQPNSQESEPPSSMTPSKPPNIPPAQLCLRKTTSSRTSYPTILSEDTFKVPKEMSTDNTHTAKETNTSKSDGSPPPTCQPEINDTSKPEDTQKTHAQPSSDLQTKTSAPKRLGLFRRLRGDTNKTPVPKILIQDFSEKEEHLTSKERRRRKREKERKEKEEKERKKREKEMEKDKVRERKKPQTRGKSFQVLSRKCPDNEVTARSGDDSQALRSRRNSAPFSDSYF